MNQIVSYFSKNAKMTLLCLTISLTMHLTPSCGTPVTNSKSVPKAILMLAVYCNAADIILKNYYERAPFAPPWNASGNRADAFSKIFSQLDFNFGINTKVIEDKSLTELETKFLVLTAQNDARIWGEFATPKCGLLNKPSETEACLRNLNSEIYKCFQQIETQVEDLTVKP